MRNEPTDWLAVITKAAKTLPEEVSTLEGVMAMEELLKDLQHKITAEQAATLVGIAAILYRQGLEEFKAQGMTHAMLKRLRD